MRQKMRNEFGGRNQLHVELLFVIEQDLILANILNDKTKVCPLPDNKNVYKLMYLIKKRRRKEGEDFDY